jgi:hypothetical protein
MDRSRLLRLLKRFSPLVTLAAVAPLVVIILGSTACVKHPIGDPERSKVDPRCSGVWLATDEQMLLLLRPYDSRTYLARILSYTSKDGVIRPQEETEAKAWLTSLGGATFLTLELLDWGHFAGLADDDLPYYVMRFDFKDDALSLRLIGGEEACKAGSRRELESVIKRNVDSESLYDDPAMDFRRADDQDLVRSVLEAFKPRGPADERP